MEIRENVLLKDFAWWKIGGPADFFCLPESVDHIREALQFAQARGLSITVLGGGTNVLISDAGVEGLVICMRKLTGLEQEDRDGRIHIKAMCGTPKSELTKIFLKRKLAPALFLCGLPGDVGGGVVMNAGVAEKIKPSEFNEITDWIEVIDLQTFFIRRLMHSDIEWQYRASHGWQPGIVIRAGISWPLSEDLEIPRKVKEATRARLEKQPLQLPSCGSTFKNPQGKKAGALIEQAGLKGFQIGQAQVSTKHANFIVNLGGASASDVAAIIAHVQNQVDSQFGVRLEAEVKFLGRW